MEDSAVTIQKQDLQKVLATASGDTALVYLWLLNGGTEAQAPEALNLSAERVSCAVALLRRLGLIAERHRFVQAEERPVFTETDVLSEDEKKNGFRELRLEIENRYGRKLTITELKSLLTIRNYLCLDDVVITILFSYCIDRNAARGNVKLPSMRSVEQEAFRWADEGIDTMAEAVAYVKQEAGRQEKFGPIRHALQIHNRRLTPSEEKYISRWLDMGYGEREIALAYDRTCLHCGNMNWNYMNAIIAGWQKQGLLTEDEILKRDKAPEKPAAKGKKPAAEQTDNTADPMILAALQRRKTRKEEN